MNGKLKTIINQYTAGVLSTPNIQILGKVLCNETINFACEISPKLTFASATFQNSELINMRFLNVNFESSFFETCSVKNSVFENAIFQTSEISNCTFQNCKFIRCNFSDSVLTETGFRECVFLKNSFNNAVFELCHFFRPIFKETNAGLLGSAIIDKSTFSNSEKSLKFVEEVYFSDIFHQINKLHMESKGKPFS